MCNDRLEAFEKMLSDIQSTAEREKQAMTELKAAGREKTATYKQYLGNKLIYSRILELYKEYGLL